MSNDLHQRMDRLEALVSAIAQHLGVLPRDHRQLEVARGERQKASQNSEPIIEKKIQSEEAPTLHRVKWLSDQLGISDKSVRDAIAAKQVPDECVLRVGSRIRIREDKALKWIAGGLKKSGRSL